MIDDFDYLDFDSFDADELVERKAGLRESIMHQRRAEKSEFIRIEKRTEAAAFLTSIPAPGHTWHIVSNAKYDFWTWVHVLIDLLGGHIDDLYGSTWTASRPNVEDLLQKLDEGKIKRAALLTGTYFKRRETSVYATLYEGLQSRGQRFVAFENHAKVLLLGKAPTFITIEGSANFTSNPRLEQYTMTNDESLFNFHRAWMEEMLSNGKRSR